MDKVTIKAKFIRKSHGWSHVAVEHNGERYHFVVPTDCIQPDAALADPGAGRPLAKAFDARAFAIECDGCGCSGFDPSEGANYAIQISDKNGLKYRPLGRFCPRCKDKEWAWQNHRYPDELYTKNEVLAGVGLEGVRGDSRADYIERIKKWVAAGLSASGAQWDYAEGEYFSANDVLKALKLADVVLTANVKHLAAPALFAAALNNVLNEKRLTAPAGHAELSEEQVREALAKLDYQYGSDFCRDFANTLNALLRASQAGSQPILDLQLFYDQLVDGQIIKESDGEPWPLTKSEAEQICEALRDRLRIVWPKRAQAGSKVEEGRE